jgi:hypothetical protein
MYMQTEHNIGLTASEISQLWSGYMNDSLSVCVLGYFLGKVEDTEIRPVIEYALKKSQAHLQKLTTIFKEANMPVPYGFTENDVNVNAPRLFSDPFMLHYVNFMTNLELGLYAISVRFAARKDIHSYFSECLTESIELDKQAKDALLSKGLFVRPPYIQTPDKVDFVKQHSFLAGWFGEQRPLVSLEIANLHANLQNNSFGKQLLTGFSQVTNSKEVGQYMVRGKEIAAKHMDIFGSALKASDLQVPMTWDASVANSTISPFSDKLMMFQATAMNALGIGFYGIGMSTTLRRDISASYVRLTAEIAKFAEEGANLMIENGWMEEPPRTPNRNELANV